MGKIEINVSGNAADWTPLGILLPIYLFYFNRRKHLINSGVAANYEKEKKKIETSFAIENQTPSFVDRAHYEDSMLTMYGLIRRIKFIRFMRNAIMKILDVIYFIAFGIFGCRIIFITINIFLRFLPFMYLAGVTLAVLAIFFTFIVARYPGGG